jgi:Ca2+-binding EF-hand superfamily protein
MKRSAFAQEIPSMRAFRLTLLGLVACLLVVTRGTTQFEGRGSTRPDPSKFFDGLSGGKDVWVRSETSANLLPMFDAVAGKLGITDGKITREQFLTNREQKRKTSKDSPNGTMPPGASLDKTRGNPMADPNQLDSLAEERFRKLDVNGDGVLDYNEMPEDLRNERDRWDTDRNGYIDLNEYKAFFRARAQQILDDRSQAGVGAPWQGAPPPAPKGGATPPVEDPRVKVYHYENLPKELPDWFKQLDTNHDAQVALYEWKASGKPIADFLRMDRNNDGFLTVEEVLWYQSQVAKGKPEKGLGSSVDRAGKAGSSDPRSPRPTFQITKPPSPR